MATQATLTSAFTKAAIRFNVAESDFLVLGTQGIASFEALAYRVPKQEDLEDILRNTLLPCCPTRHIREMTVWSKSSTETRR